MSGRVVLYRGACVESVHRVHVSVVDSEGRGVGGVGDPGFITFVRSAAKPFQAVPLVEDGVVDALGIPDAGLALCCASHSGEPEHVDGVRDLLARGGIPEEALECGAHPPMDRIAADELQGRGGVPGRIHNNCSGKHAGMLLLARHHGWPLRGYRLAEHPVQQRMKVEMSRWSGVPVDEIREGVDGCGVTCFALPLSGLARAFASLGKAAAHAPGEGAASVIGAMAGHPFRVAGTGRLCTRMIETTRGRIVTKVGAEGVYAALDREQGLGIALKVEDGARRGAEVALVRVLELLGSLRRSELEAFSDLRPMVISNTRGEGAAELRAEFELGAGIEEGVRARAMDRASGSADSFAPVLVGVAAALAVAAVSPGGEAQLREALKRARDESADHPQRRVQIEEVLVQGYLFLGYPAALNGLALWREISGEPAGDSAESGPGGWADRGESVCRAVYGDQFERLRGNISWLHPDMDRWMVEEGYGKVLGRPGLRLRERELCVVATLAVLAAPVQLYSHLRGCLRTGATRDEVESAILAAEVAMRGMDGGWERTLSAKAAWERVQGRGEA